MKKMIVLGMTLVLTGIAMMSTGCDNEGTEFKDVPTTYIIPGVVECIGHTELDYIGPYSDVKNLVCEDGRVFHNIVNYQKVKQINPLYQGGK